MSCRSLFENILVKMWSAHYISYIKTTVLRLEVIKICEVVTQWCRLSQSHGSFLTSGLIDKVTNLLMKCTLTELILKAFVCFL